MEWRTTFSPSCTIQVYVAKRKKKGGKGGGGVESIIIQCSEGAKSTERSKNWVSIRLFVINKHTTGTCMSPWENLDRNDNTQVYTAGVNTCGDRSRDRYCNVTRHQDDFERGQPARPQLEKLPSGPANREANCYNCITYVRPFHSLPGL